MRLPRTSPDSTTGAGDVALVGLSAALGGAGQSVRDTRARTFPVVITGHAGDNRYAFVRADDTDPEAFPELDNAADAGDGESVAAFELNLRDDVPADGTVRASAWVLPEGRGVGFVYTPTTAGGTGSAGCGCDWVAALQPNHCLRMTVLGAGGRCACGASPGTVLSLKRSGSVWKPRSNGTLTVCGATYTAEFSKEACDGPCLKLVKVAGSSGGGSVAPSYAGVRGCCGPDYATFGFGDPALCTNTEAADGRPSANELRVKVEWVECDTAVELVEAPCCPGGASRYFSFALTTVQSLPKSVDCDGYYGVADGSPRGHDCYDCGTVLNRTYCLTFNPAYANCGKWEHPMPPGICNPGTGDPTDGLRIYFTLYMNRYQTVNGLQTQVEIQTNLSSSLNPTWSASPADANAWDCRSPLTLYAAPDNRMKCICSGIPDQITIYPGCDGADDCVKTGWAGAGWYVASDGSGGCAVAHLQETDRCDPSVVIQSGPYVSEADAASACSGGGDPVAGYRCASGVCQGAVDVPGASGFYTTLAACQGACGGGGSDNPCPGATYRQFVDGHSLAIGTTGGCSAFAGVYPVNHVAPTNSKVFKAGGILDLAEVELIPDGASWKMRITCNGGVTNFSVSPASVVCDAADNTTVVSFTGTSLSTCGSCSGTIHCTWTLQKV